MAGKGNLTNIAPYQFRPGVSGNPSGRPSSKAAIDHAMTETSNGKEIVERLIDLMRHGKREQTRLKAACELRDWCFGSPSPDHAVALDGGALTGRARRDPQVPGVIRGARTERRGHRCYGGRS